MVDHYGCKKQMKISKTYCQMGNTERSTRGVRGPVPLSSLPAQLSGVPYVVLKGGKAKLFSGDMKSPIVYGGAVDRVVGRPAPKDGDAVLLCNGNEEVLGWGVLNSNSTYRVRILQTVDEIDVTKSINIDEILEGRIAEAIELRKSLGFAGDRNSAFRLVNSEGDRLSGLIIDVIGNVAVVVSSALWIELRRDVIETKLLRLLPDVISDIVWRPARELLEKEEGMTSVEEESQDGGSADVVIKEHQIKFLVNPRGGQKTGFYADQRANREMVSRLSRGRHVLDLCCYTGGFALHAASGGAESVTGVDSSEAAITVAQRNATMNGFNIEFERNDAAKFMRQAIDDGRKWDVVILDPPKLAPSRKSLPTATRKYVSLNMQAMKIVRPGGLLLSCSCSGAMTQSGEFPAVLRKAANRAGVKITILSRSSTGQDHCLNPDYMEGDYLSAYLLRVL